MNAFAQEANETSTMNVIRDVINSAEFNKEQYIQFMKRLETFAQTEQKIPTMVKEKEINTTIPLLPPPPSRPKSPSDLIQL